MVNKDLLKKAAIEDDFDEAFATIHEAVGYDMETPNLYVFPNVSEVRRILQTAKCEYHEIGLWIMILAKETSKMYDDENEVWDALEKSDLVPLVGMGQGASDYIDFDF